MNTILRKILLIALTTFVIGCVDKKEINIKKTNVASQKASETILDKQQNSISDSLVVPENCGLNFEDFFYKFSRDSIFQKSRVKFPLKMIYYDVYSSDPSTPIEERIDAIDYQFMDFSVDDIASKKDVNKYSTKIEKSKNDTYYYYHLGIDNGISIMFKFVKENDCWIFVSVKDDSA